jgi:predicted phosphodiesterase
MFYRVATDASADRRAAGAGARRPAPKASFRSDRPESSLSGGGYVAPDCRDAAGSLSGSRREAGPAVVRVSESSMRLAIFSDVHGQVGPLSACLDAIARVGADELWCLGDAVDRFSVRRPELTVACVQAIDGVCAVKLAGNHEAWALQDRSLPDAAAMLLASWGVAALRDGILAVHGSPHNPLMGHLTDERDVREALRRLPGWLCVHGHTHQAALWIGRSDGTIERQRRRGAGRLDL